LEHCPADTTQIFIDYYTAKFRPKKDAVVVTTVTATSAPQSTSFASSAVQNLAALLPLPYMSMSSERPTSTDQKTQTQIVESENNEPPPMYHVPKPRGAFSAFADHSKEFVIFLEACIQSNSFKEDDKTDLYTTLFEMYLRTANEKNRNEKAEWESKAKHLIEGKEVSWFVPKASSRWY